MISIKLILRAIGVLLLGAIGALIFNFFGLPYMIASVYFDQFQFVKDFKQGKIVVNQQKDVYIQENTAIQNGVEKVQKSIALIQSTRLGPASALVATTDGLLVTLASAIPASGNFTVSLRGEKVDFKVVKTDAKNNLALIKIDKNNLQTVGFADFSKIKLGQAVFLVAPTKDSWTADEGIVRQIDPNLIKTNISGTSVEPGAPLFNSAGELVGLGFNSQDSRISAVPIDKIQALLGL